MTRQEIIDLIHNEYDPRPNLGRGDYPAFDWDDGSGRIADAVMQRIEALEAALCDAERFVSYLANETDGHFVGSGTPTTCLVMIRAALAPEQGK